MEHTNPRIGTIPAILALAASAVLVGCIQLNPVGSEDLARGAVSAGTIGASDSMRPPSAAVAQQASGPAPASLSAFEIERRKKLNKVLAFYGVQPGLTVLDLYSNGGYYTQQLSKVIGNSGRIVAYSERPDRNFGGAEIENAYASSGYPNVEVLASQNGELELPANTFDLVLMAQSLHDIYAASANLGSAAPDVATVLAEIYSSMRPGAILGIVDNNAERGAPASTAASLHRIDSERVKRDVMAAGFLFDGESDVLRNFGDDLTQPAVGSQAGRMFDQMVFRFRKPVR